MDCADYQNNRIPANKVNAASIKGIIQSELAANDVNVVFLIGHVTIPYSGSGSTEDGHATYINASDPGHPGAWPTDSWYGSFSGSWADAAINLPNDAHWEWCWNRNVPNDGRWEQGSLPAPLDVPIGRIDFHLMAPFKLAAETMNNTQDDTEIRLLKQYLDKTSRYRRGLLTPTFPDGLFLAGR